MLQASFTISSEKLRAISHNPQKCVKAVNLVYVSDSDEGIRRVKKGKRFAYTYQDEVLKDKDDLERIKKIVIPPAWENVWICKKDNGHIQATGYDIKLRKQYRYHPLWNELRNHTKFSRLLFFGEKLPLLRSCLEKDLKLKYLCEDKVLAAVISLMELTYIRIGNSEYEKLYGSYGLTTLKDQHVKINGDNICFSFRGKKGKEHKISLKNKKLARIVKECREIPGKELFQYYDKTGIRHSIDSGSVNRYLRRITEEDFTAKDFRTWAGTVNALHAFQHSCNVKRESDRKKKINEAIDYVSNKLGNTRTVCKKYYIHPLILNMYEQKSLDAYFKNFNSDNTTAYLSGWTYIEKVLLHILKTH
jgi:DNA topoisomerase I